MASVQYLFTSNLVSVRAKRTLLVVLLMLSCAITAHAKPPKLKQFRSRSYLIHTNLTRDEVRAYGKHMDAVFAQFEERFRDFHSRGAIEMPLYLLRTEAQYQAFMKSKGINAKNTGGMFFYSPKGQGLATWTQGRSRSQTFKVLQHEGFHQFAFNYIGQTLPTWINEGLAQYFEDAIILDDKMTTGLANARRVEQVRQALADGKTLKVSELVSTDAEDWADALRTDPERASLLYAQSWSIVFFLINGEDQRYQSAFGRYLKRVGEGRESRAAMEEAFGNHELTGLERRWIKFAKDQEPDPINLAATRMEFLGEALRYMHENGAKTPKNLSQLRDLLQARQFVLTRMSHGVTVKMDAKDPSLYRYARRNGTTGLFRLLEPARDDLPARITATGLRPEPTLVWSRDNEGKLVQDIEYR